MAPLGIYRVRNGWENGHSVCGRYSDGMHLEIAESRYRMRNHLPAFDDLPWKNRDLPRKASSDLLKKKARL